MFIPYNHSSIRLTGRFYEEKKAVSTTACGSTIELAVKSDYVILHFNMTDLIPSYPLLYIQIDGGDLIGSAVASRLFLRMTENREHQIRIIFQSAVEFQSRWSAPVQAKISFEGCEAEDSGLLPADNRKTITFIGDSITEGILIHPDEKPYEDKMMYRVYQDDVTRSYAWLLAEHFNLRATFCGYGGVGFTRGGSGGVPKAQDMYDFCVENVLYKEPYAPDYILINHGCNDRGADADTYLTEYRMFLDRMTARYPESQFIILSPFIGAFHEELNVLIDTYFKEHTAKILYIDSDGWVEKEPLHPLAEGHKRIAERLIERTEEIFGREAESMQ